MIKVPKVRTSSAAYVNAIWITMLLLVLAWGPWARAVEIPFRARQLLSAATALNATGNVVGPDVLGQSRESAIYISWLTGTTVGAVQVESAYASNCDSYTGTWAPEGSAVSFSGTAPKQDLVQITGVHQCLRTRVSTSLQVGTVDTWFLSN